MTDEPLATVVVDAHHSAYVDAGAVTDDPTLRPEYDGADPAPGTLLIVADRDGWATLHRVEARRPGKVEFGPRLPWPGGGIAARKLP